MTRKEQLLRMIEKLPDDVSFDRVLYHLEVLQSIEQGTRDMGEGKVIDHDELFDRLLKEDEENPDCVDRAGGGVQSS